MNKSNDTPQAHKNYTTGARPTAMKAKRKTGRLNFHGREYITPEEFFNICGTVCGECPAFNNSLYSDWTCEDEQRAANALLMGGMIRIKDLAPAARAHIHAVLCMEDYDAEGDGNGDK